jgi:hypothetical protein
MQQLSVEMPMNAEEVGNEEQRDKTCAEQVDEENVEDGRST